MIKRLTKREQQIFIFCVVLAAVYGVVYGLIKPLKSKAVSLDDDIMDAQKLFQKNARVVSRGKSLDGAYDFYLTRFKQSKPNDEVMTSVISEIQGLARELNLQISDLQPQRVKSDAYFNHFSVSLTIDSSFQDTLQFLYTLQKDPHYFRVDELNFDKGARTQDNAIKTRLVLSKVFIF